MFSNNKIIKENKWTKIDILDYDKETKFKAYRKYICESVIKRNLKQKMLLI